MKVIQRFLARALVSAAAFSLAVAPFSALADNLSPGPYNPNASGGAAGTPLYDVPVIGSGAQSQSNPAPTYQAVPAPMSWSATSAGNATITTPSGTTTAYDLSVGNFQYAVVYVVSAGTGGVISFNSSDGTNGTIPLQMRRSDNCQWLTTVNYSAYFVVPLHGRSLSIAVASITGGTASGTLYLTNADPYGAYECQPTSPQYIITQASVTTGGSVQLALTRTGVRGTGRRYLVVTNSGTGIVSCSSLSTVTATTGRLITAGQQTEPMPYDGAWWCISVSGTNIVSAFELE